MMTTELTNLHPLVDGDILLYRCGFAADSQMKKRFREDGMPEEDIPAAVAETDYCAFALANTKTVMMDFGNRFDGNAMRTFLTGNGNFREQIATILPYKGNRTAAKPKYYKDIKEYLIQRWDAEVVHGQEADDMLGIIQSQAPENTTIIVSIDKDLDQIAGNHYNLMKAEHYVTDQHWCDQFFFKQMLLGDRTDNIPGIDQIGEVRASKILEEAGGDIDRLRQMVIEKYKEQYGAGWDAAYHEVGALLWIRRAPDQEPILL